MKSLILKDLYNIGHNSKSMLFMLIVFWFLFVSSNGPTTYIIMCCVLCSMMVVTTFAFDEKAQWTAYAIIMPISKKQIVKSKFIVLLIFTLIGALFGFIFGGIGGIVFQKLDYKSLEDWLTLTASSGVGLVISFLFGSIVIPLIYKFGAEKARVLSMVAFALPIMIFAGLYQLLMMAGVVFNSTIIDIGLIASPVVVLIWSILMYRISYKIFSHKEF